MTNEVKDGLEVMKNETSVEIEDKDFYVDKNSRLKYNPEAFLAQYLHALKNKAGILRQKASAIGQITNAVLEIDNRIGGMMKATQENLDLFSPHIMDAYKKADSIMEDKMFMDATGPVKVKKTMYKKSKKELTKAIAELEILIETEIKRLKDITNEVLGD